MIDTNVFISMIFFPSAKTDEFAKRLADGGHQILVCDYVMEELRLVIDRKFSEKRKNLDRFFLKLPFELICTPKILDLDHIPKMRDTKDWPILATAVLEKIDILVTGDKDFLVLDIDMPEIVTMTEFIDRY